MCDLVGFEKNAKMMKSTWGVLVPGSLDVSYSRKQGFPVSQYQISGWEG